MYKYLWYLSVPKGGGNFRGAMSLIYRDKLLHGVAMHVDGRYLHFAAMNRDIAPFGLRIPTELKTRIEESAAQNLRSLNAEMLVRLENSFYAEQLRLQDFTTGQLIQELLRRDEPGRIVIEMGGDK